MSSCCNGPCQAKPPPPRYRKVLWAALSINAAMFALEFASSFAADSTALLADAIDFLGDAGNYAVSLFVLGLAAHWRSRTAYAKGVVMGIFGVAVLARACWLGVGGAVPDAPAMGAIGMLALVANGVVAALLYAFRDGDANMRSVWLCTRNDMIGNVAVLLAALGVFGTGSGWPDIVVAALMAVLALSGAHDIVRRARLELRAVPDSAQASTPLTMLRDQARGPVQIRRDTGR